MDVEITRREVGDVGQFSFRGGSIFAHILFGQSHVATNWGGVRIRVVQIKNAPCAQQGQGPNYTLAAIAAIDDYEIKLFPTATTAVITLIRGIGILYVCDVQLLQSAVNQVKP